MRSQWDALDVELITLETKCIDFMRFASISINLLKIFRIISFVLDLKYLSQNSTNFNMLGVFWNPQDKQFPKLSLDLHFEQHLKEGFRPLKVMVASTAVHCALYLLFWSSPTSAHDVWQCMINKTFSKGCLVLTQLIDVCLSLKIKTFYSTKTWYKCQTFYSNSDTHLEPLPFTYQNATFHSKQSKCY